MVYDRIDSFVRQAQGEEIDVMVEDFDNPRSLCYDTPALDRLFTEVPALNHVFDTGNYLSCGEDMLEYAATSIANIDAAWNEYENLQSSRE